MFKLIVSLFKKKQFIIYPPAHSHQWGFRFYTGKAENGKTSVYKCECGRWAIRHFGTVEYILTEDQIK